MTTAEKSPRAVPWVFGVKLVWNAPSGLWLADIGALRIGLGQEGHGWNWFVGHAAYGRETDSIRAVEAIKRAIAALRDELVSLPPG